MRKKRKAPWKFVVGSMVKWKSQAQGCWAEKIGKVIAIVPAGKHACDVLQLDALASKYLLAIDSFSRVRKVESYVVEVAPKGKGKPRLYWPVPTLLEPA